MSNIEWTTTTWNPTVGCSKLSQGCAHCYAVREAHRLGSNPNPKISSVYEGLTHKNGTINWTGKVRFIPERLEKPLHWRKPRRIFVDSMSDLFHEQVTDEQRDQIFAVMALTPQHTYQMLTKRADRMRAYLSDGHRFQGIHEAIKQRLGYNSDRPAFNACDLPLSNVWLGVSVENQEQADMRIPLLLKTPAAVRFLSCEPLLEEIELYNKYLEKEIFSEVPRPIGVEKRTTCCDWLIVGGESGHGARPCKLAWIRGIIRQCENANVPCFVKQLGGNVWDEDERLQLRDRKGGDPSEWPHDLRVREFPRGAVLCSN